MGLRAVRKQRRLGVVVFCLAMSAVFPLRVLAERLAVKTYTMADGLPRNFVNCITRDSHGFLWFCTDDGLSRFDGYTFTNYGTEQGLPEARVSEFLESRSGEYWVATADGLCRFNPQSSPGSGRAPVPGSEPSRRPMFEVFRPGPGDMERRISAIAEARDGSIWCGTLGGLHRFTPGVAGHFEYTEVVPGRPPVEALRVDHEDALWVVLDGAVLRRWPDGRIERYTEREGLPGGETHHLRVSDLLEDASGRLWMATWSGLCRLVADPMPGRPVVERVYTTRDGLPDDHIESLFQSADGVLWVTARGRLAEFVPGGEESPRPFQSHFNAGGAVGEDATGNLWINTSRWARNGFANYTVEDGLAGASIFSIFEDRLGRLGVVTGDKWDRGGVINRLEGQRFVSMKPKVPEGILRYTWGLGRIHFQDHTGAWWIATDQGLCRYPMLRRMEDLARTLPEPIYTKRDGLPGDGIYQLYEDSRGDVWISVVGPNVVTRWSRADGTFHNYAKTSEGKELGTPYSFGEDRAGNLWMGFFWHNLARYRNGRFQVFTSADGLPPGVVRSIYSDRAGRLWLASSRGGLLRVDDPAADRIRFAAYTTTQGLSSNETWCITEDAWGRIYVGTGRGVDRLDPQTGHIQHYSAAAGLGFQDPPRVAFRDRRGVLWFGGNGLARLAPGPGQPQPPPPIRITFIRLRGNPYSLSELGETALRGPTLKPDQNQVEFGYSSLNFAAGEVIRYQYKLERSDRDWSPLTDLRTVNYNSLSPGSYRFLVRAVNSEGAPSRDPAWVTFVILRPIWQRWWVLTLTVLAGGALVYAMFRYRLNQLLELERVRTRIAADLHDDIGSSLTQISIMSEVARQQAAAACESPSCPIHPSLRVSEPLAKVAELSRGLVDSMSDVVWAVNPRRDHLSDLSHRMRRFASDVLSARSIEFGFSAPGRLGDAPLGADVRREVFLVFKESVNNIARHSKCQRVEITLEIEGSRLLMTVSDDGRGFELTRADNSGQAGGHGLNSMGRRAHNVGGNLRVTSKPGGGTCILMEVPLDRNPLLGRRKSLPE